MIMSGNEAWTTLHKPRRSYYYYYLRSDGTNTSFVNWRLFRVHSLPQRYWEEVQVEYRYSLLNVAKLLVSLAYRQLFGGDRVGSGGYGPPPK